MTAERHVIICIIRVGDNQRFGAVRTAVNPFYAPHGADKIFCQIIRDFINSGKILRVTVNINQILQIFHVLFNVVCCHVVLRYSNQYITTSSFMTHMASSAFKIAMHTIMP